MSSINLRLPDNRIRALGSRLPRRPSNLPPNHKFAPGNYVLPRGTSSGVTQAAIDLCINTPEFVGMQARYLWKTLETAFDVYDFSVIHSVLDQLRAAGKYLVVQWQVKNFQNGSDYLPAYLTTDPLYNGGKMQAVNEGYSPLFWDTNVLARMKALLTAMAAEFESDPNFVMVNFNESILGIWQVCSNPPGGYTPEGYRDALIELITHAKSVFPTTHVIQYLNFFDCKSSYLGEVAAAAHAVGAGFGGPDVKPRAPELMEHGYQYYPIYDGLCTKATAVQYKNYLEETDEYGNSFTAEQILLFAKQYLGLDYIFWEERNDPIDYIHETVLPTLRKWKHLFPRYV